ncbi:MAG: hypothetical protein C5B44_04630, partial [Acidobacteria bacterium]
TQSREEPIVDEKREFLRHCLATLAYRGGKALRDAPEGFAEFQPGATSRTPGQILAHLGDLLEWAWYLSNNEKRWQTTETTAWAPGVDRFFQTLNRLDQRLAADEALGCSEERLFQGPIADALSHVGQIAMLRRMAGGPIRGENYFLAKIEAGRTGSEQHAAVYEFD